MIGIMPRIAAAAVSMIGRNLWVVASITAFQGSTPCARSCSIWWTRITELRMIMPASAMMPSVAMKPIGVFVVSSAAGDPDEAERRHADHHGQSGGSFRAAP